MIEAADLRIGNLVQDEYFRTGVVKRIAEHSVSVKMQHSTLRRDSEHDFEGLDIEPIPLTEDILIKCGFEYIKNEEMSECLGGDMSLYKKNKIEIFLPEGSCNVLMNYEFENRVQYLHQLQNLFYCLTGKELEITL